MADPNRYGAPSGRRVHGLLYGLGKIRGLKERSRTIVLHGYKYNPGWVLDVGLHVSIAFLYISGRGFTVKTYPKLSLV
jgi:hypothetical protein